MKHRPPSGGQTLIKQTFSTISLITQILKQSFQLFFSFIRHILVTSISLTSKPNSGMLFKLFYQKVDQARRRIPA